MKKNLRILAYLAFLAFCIIMVIKEFDAMDKQQEIIDEVSCLGGINIINDFILLKPQPLLVLALWSTMIILLISALMLSAEKKFKPVDNREYEILKRIDDESYHSMVLGYYDKNNFYRSEIIEWNGKLILAPEELYLEEDLKKEEEAMLTNTFFIKKIENGFEFLNVSFAEMFTSEEAQDAKKIEKSKHKKRMKS